MTSKYQRCCMVTNVFGYPLKQGIVIVAVSSIIVSMAVLFTSLIFVLPRWSPSSSYNTDPLNAIYFMSALVGTSTSMYEIIISIAMLWFMRWKKAVFLLSLWFVSNVVLMTVFIFLIVARTCICFVAREYTLAFFNAFLGITYEVVFTYFCIIVNSYECSLDPDTVYY